MRCREVEREEDVVVGEVRWLSHFLHAAASVVSVSTAAYYHTQVHRGDALANSNNAVKFN